MMKIGIRLPYIKFERSAAFGLKRKLIKTLVK